MNHSLVPEVRKRSGKGTHLDVVTIPQSTKLLLSSGIPNVEADGTKVGVESERVDLYSESGNVLLLKLSLLVIRGVSWARRGKDERPKGRTVKCCERKARAESATAMNVQRVMRTYTLDEGGLSRSSVSDCIASTVEIERWERDDAGG